MNFDTNNECSVTIETDNGLQTCLNQKCSDYKDPWRIVNTYLEDKPCYMHYLKLAFSNYDQFIVFVELQQTDNYSIDKFFAQDSKLCMLEIEIDTIYPFNKNYFLNREMLVKLGSQETKIHMLQIIIKTWYRSLRSVVQIIDNDMIDFQPFRQITILFYCNLRERMERWVLARYLDTQENSPCPTQMKIFSKKDQPTLNEEKLSLKKEKLKNDPPIKHFINKDDYLKKVNLTYFTFDKPHTNKKSNGWTLAAKIIIPIIIVILIIIFIIYQFCFSSQQSNNT